MSFRKINFRHLMTDLILTGIAFYLSLFLRVNPGDAAQFLPSMHRIIFVVLIFRLLAYIYFETFNIIWRYVSAIDAFTLAKAVLTSSFCIVATTYILNLGVVPRSIYFIDAFLVVSLLSGVRLARRLLFEYQSNRQMQKFGSKTLIFGAGVTGQGVLKRLLVDKELKLFVLGFVDDDKLKIGKSILGYKVFGGLNNLEDLIRHLEIVQIVVAIPDPTPSFLKELLEICAPFGIKPLLLNTGAGSELTAPLRRLELSDLLRRAPHKIDLTSTEEMIAGKRILITGAGGSIGSEISRQVLSFGPSRLVILDHSELNLYNIDQELKSVPRYEELVVPSLVDVKDFDSLEQVFNQYTPEIVIHAAAYKHVHLVESNPHTSIQNNILGTQNLLRLSEKVGVDNFVLISTDKAVNPAGVMGSTKRICEILTAETGLRTQKNYCAVRFGNVLGSSGSLIPLLKKQIENGQPLTITHADVTRYFMLIEEAVSLVLKAASFSAPGDINVLRMGEPVKIIDIAKSLITLMGKTEEQVQIEFTGLRPGEKMFEELYISGNELNTEHPDILVVPRISALPPLFNGPEFLSEVREMCEAAKTGNKNAIYILSRLVNSNYEHPTYEGQLKTIKLSGKA